MDAKDRRNVFLAHVIVIGITDLLITRCVASPMFDPEPEYIQLYESTPIGTTLFVLRATDDNVQNEMVFNTFSAETNEYVNINQTSIKSPATANITLKKELDRELLASGIVLMFSLIDTIHNVITNSVVVFILDVCDEPPKFDDLFYMLEINETDVNTPTLVFTKIRATDRDNGNYSIVTYSMEPKTESEERKQMYREMFTIDHNNGNVFLMRNLDYKLNNVYQFTLNANDGCGLTANPAILIIIVVDVPETTTFFTRLPYTSNEYDENQSTTQLSQVTAFNGTTISYSTNKYQSLNVPLLASLIPVLLVVLIFCTVLGIFIWRRKQNDTMSNTKRNSATGSVKEVALTEPPEAAYESLDDYYISLDKSKGINPEYDQITHDYKNKT